MKKDRLRWELINSRIDRLYALFSVTINTNKSPRTGELHEFQVLNSPDWVAVIPVTPNNEMVMVRQYRHGSGSISLEPPGGLVKPGQTPEQSAVEELEEETGYVASEIEQLGCMNPLPALFDNKFYVFLAKNATPSGKPNPDDTEELETILIPVDEIREYIRSGRIDGGIMISALLIFMDYWEAR